MVKTGLCMFSLFVIFSMAVPVLSGGQSIKGPVEGSGQVETMTICQEPRPQICTMDYQPVCAQLEGGTFKTYSNACTACADTLVSGHSEGACE
jgi:hypothetical protein